MKKHSIVTAFDYENVNYNLMIHVVLQVIVCQSIMVFSLLQQRVFALCAFQILAMVLSALLAYLLRRRTSMTSANARNGHVTCDVNKMDAD